MYTLNKEKGSFDSKKTKEGKTEKRRKERKSEVFTYSCKRIINFLINGREGVFFY